MFGLEDTTSDITMDDLPLSTAAQRQEAAKAQRQEAAKAEAAAAAAAGAEAEAKIVDALAEAVENIALDPRVSPRALAAKIPRDDPPLNLDEFNAMTVKLTLAGEQEKANAAPPTDDKCGDTTLLFGPVCSLTPTAPTLAPTAPTLAGMLAADSEELDPVVEEITGAQNKRFKTGVTPLVGGGADDQKIGLLKHILNNARAAAGDAAVAKFSGLWSDYFNDVELGDDEFPREFHSNFQIQKKRVTVGPPPSVWMRGTDAETRSIMAEYMNVKTMPSVALLEDTEDNAEDRAQALEVANNILREEGKATLAYMKLYFPGSSLFRNDYAVTEDRKTVARYIWALTFICLNPDKVTAAPAVTDRKILINAQTLGAPPPDIRRVVFFRSLKALINLQIAATKAVAAVGAAGAAVNIGKAFTLTATKMTGWLVSTLLTYPKSMVTALGLLIGYQKGYDIILRGQLKIARSNLYKENLLRKKLHIRNQKDDCNRQFENLVKAVKDHVFKQLEIHTLAHFYNPEELSKIIKCSLEYVINTRGDISEVILLTNNPSRRADIIVRVILEVIYPPLESEEIERLRENLGQKVGVTPEDPNIWLAERRAALATRVSTDLARMNFTVAGGIDYTRLNETSITTFARYLHNKLIEATAAGGTSATAAGGTSAAAAVTAAVTAAATVTAAAAGPSAGANAAAAGANAAAAAITPAAAAAAAATVRANPADASATPQDIALRKMLAMDALWTAILKTKTEISAASDIDLATVESVAAAADRLSGLMLDGLRKKDQLTLLETLCYEMSGERVDRGDLLETELVEFVEMLGNDDCDGVFARLKKGAMEARKNFLKFCILRFSKWEGAGNLIGAQGATAAQGAAAAARTAGGGKVRKTRKLKGGRRNKYCEPKKCYTYCAQSVGKRRTRKRKKCSPKKSKKGYCYQRVSKDGYKYCYWNKGGPKGKCKTKKAKKVYFYNRV
jgi:hypothetical protein